MARLLKQYTREQTQEIKTQAEAARKGSRFVEMLQQRRAIRDVLRQSELLSLIEGQLLDCQAIRILNQD